MAEEYLKVFPESKTIYYGIYSRTLTKSKFLKKYKITKLYKSIEDLKR